MPLNEFEEVRKGRDLISFEKSEGDCETQTVQLAGLIFGQAAAGSSVATVSGKWRKVVR
jgi:hypothetical protein